MANVFDSRGAAQAYATTRSAPGGGILRALDLLQRRIDSPVRDIVDIGCGTGRLSQTLATTFGARVVGVDPSAAMRTEAEQAHRTNARLSFRDGCGEALPLPDASIDLAFAALSFHFFTDRPGAVMEMERVLRPGGHVAIWTPTSDTMDHDRMHAFFPETQALDDARMPTVPEIEGLARGAGLAHVLTQTVADSESDPSTFLAQIEARAFSTLRLIDDAAFAAGLAHFKSHLATGGTLAPGNTVLLLFRKT